MLNERLSRTQVISRYEGSPSILDFGAVRGTSESLIRQNDIAFAKAEAATTGGGVIIFPVGEYPNSYSFTPSSGATYAGVGAGAVRLLRYGSGTQWDLSATDLADDVVIRDLTVRCYGSAYQGVVRSGRTTQAFDNALMRQTWLLENMVWQGMTSPPLAGSIGLSATQYIGWQMQNVTINNFERPDLLYRGGGPSIFDMVRRIGFRFGSRRFNDIGGCQDIERAPWFIGPTTSGRVAGEDYGYTCEVDATDVTFQNAIYEPIPGQNSQAHLYLGSRCGGFQDNNGAFSGGAASSNKTIVFADGYNHPVFIGTKVPIPGYNAIQFGTSVAKAEFIGCNKELNDLVRAQPADRYAIVGSQ